jgi:hypothetical protein
MMKPRFFNHAAFSKTGGVRSRDEAFAACVDQTNRCNHVARVIDMGGPLDAPQEMPAGGCNSDLWTDWRGNPMPTTSTVERGS